MVRPILNHFHVIQEKATSERSFANLYARLCSVLILERIFYVKLLDACQDLYQSTVVPASAKDSTLTEKMLAVDLVRFLGHLYCWDSFPKDPFCCCLKDLFNICKNSGPSDEKPWECICALMTLTGVRTGGQVSYIICCALVLFVLVLREIYFGVK